MEDYRSEDRRARFRGVSWHKRNGRYRVKLKTHGRHVFLGYYDDPRVAARVYDVAATMVHGSDAQLNFDGKPPATIPKAAILQLLLDKGVLVA